MDAEAVETLAKAFFEAFVVAAKVPNDDIPKWEDKEPGADEVRDAIRAGIRAAMETHYRMLDALEQSGMPEPHRVST
jgi:hypothetical protein